MESKAKPELEPPRVVLFPLSGQGHVSPMLMLAELLALSGGVHVTVVNTDYVHRRISAVRSRLSLYPGFLFRTISDGLSGSHSRSSSGGFMEMIRSMHETTKPLFKNMLVSGELGSPVSCIIADGIFASLVCDVGDELGIPVVLFRTVSACCFWSYFNIPKLIQSGELPPRGKEDMDRKILGVPGMETFLRLRDLPSFCRSTDTKDDHLHVVHRETCQSIRARGIIFNTFEDLEGPIVSHIRNNWPNVYTLGPLHQHLNIRLSEKKNDNFSLSRRPQNNSLFDVDDSCMVWLDSQPPKSVIYVSFGSVVVMTKENLMEFWHGLVNSKKRFLWVIRRDLLAAREGENERDPQDELSKATKDRGFIAEWVPQEEVLSHVAMGGFLTHSGWNSTLESIVAGVPMICWPYFADQQINSRFVGEVWKLGIDMKDVCDRKVVEKMINDLMVERGDELARSMVEMARLAKRSVSQGGSSYCDMDRLIEDIWSMRKQ